jgi:arsenate reductase
MKVKKREVEIYYNPGSVADRRTIAYAQSLSPHIKSYSYDKLKVTSTKWYNIISQLNVDPKSLFNKALPEYQSNIKGKDLDMEGWINVIQRNKHLLKAPIAMRGHAVVLCESPTEIE